MKSRKWFEDHGYRRQVRLYDEDRKLIQVHFPKNVTQQRKTVRELRRRGFTSWCNKAGRVLLRTITRIVVWSPEGDERIEVA